MKKSKTIELLETITELEKLVIQLISLIGWIVLLVLAIKGLLETII